MFVMHSAGPWLWLLSSPGAIYPGAWLQRQQGTPRPSDGLHSGCSLFLAGSFTYGPHSVAHFLGVLVSILVCIYMYPLKQWQGFCPLRTPVATL